MEEVKNRCRNHPNKRKNEETLMSMEMMKKAVLGAAGAIALLGAASAQALTLQQR